MNEAVFLHALHVDPYDPVAWLALADWLDEDGQAQRAELLRLVRRLRDLSVMRRTVDRVKLEARVAQLLLAGVRPAVPEWTNSIGMRLALIPPGCFRMGAPKSEFERFADETAHKVEITRPFYLGVFSVTQAQYETIMGENPSHNCATGPNASLVADFDTGDFPVEMVSWLAAVEFCRRLSERERRKYRLPTEAEWEYACRGGSASTTPFYFGDELPLELANYNGRESSGLGRTCRVGSFPPNAFGLYDMHGNVFDWCADWMGKYPNKAVKDPKGPKNGTARTIRGGGWACVRSHCRSANRGQNDINYRGYQNGLRVALDAPIEGLGVRGEG